MTTDPSDRPPPGLSRPDAWNAMLEAARRTFRGRRAAPTTATPPAARPAFPPAVAPTVLRVYTR